MHITKKIKRTNKNNPDLDQLAETVNKTQNRNIAIILGGAIAVVLIAVVGLYFLIQHEKPDPNQATMPSQYINGQVFNILEGDILYVHKMYIEIDLEHKIWVGARSETYPTVDKEYEASYVAVKRVKGYYEVTISDLVLEKTKWTPRSYVGYNDEMWLKVSKFTAVKGSLSSFFTKKDG